MSIADKLVQIAQNEQKIYDAGYNAGMLNSGDEAVYEQGFKTGQESITNNMEVIERTVTGDQVIKLTDVSEVPHKIQVQLSNENLEDISTVKVRGKNLCNLGTVKVTNSYIAKSLSQPIEAGVTYSVSMTATSSDTDSDKCYLIFYNKQLDKQILQTTAVTRNERWSGIYTFPEEVDELRFYASSSWQSGQGDTATFTEIQIEEGTTATDYEPYVEPAEYPVNADGNVLIDSLCPCTIIIANAHIIATYQRSYGMQREYDSFWDMYQNSGKRTNYAWAFSGEGWNDTTTQLKYSLDDVTITYAYMMFAGTGIKDVGKIFPKLTTNYSSQYMFFASMGETPATTHIGELIINDDGYGIFSGAKNLETIDRFVLNKATASLTSAFNNCSALKNITIEGSIGASVNFKWSTLLTKASIESIVNALSTTASGLTLTLSQTAVANAFETSEGAADGNTSAEWSALTATRSNWTFSLV